MNTSPDFLRPLLHIPDFAAGFVARIPGVQTSTDKNETLGHAQSHHDQAARDLGFKKSRVHLAEQIHGCDIALIDENPPAISHSVDGLITNRPGILLGIHIADCGALYLADPVTGAIGLLHSGKKGSELNITGVTIAAMTKNFGTNPSDLIAVLAPCIRPPHYEIDFAQTIHKQALEAGINIENYHDCGLCTASEPKKYYSYRLEKGDTGRMLALLGKRMT